MLRSALLLVCAVHCCLVYGQQSVVAPYVDPPQDAVLDKYSAEISFVTANIPPSSSGRVFELDAQHGSPVEGSLWSSMLVSAFTFDCSYVGSVPTSTVSITYLNATALLLEVRTTRPAVVHAALITAAQSNTLLNRTKTIFQMQWTNGVPFIASIVQRIRYRQQLALELVDRAGGRGPLWGAREILFPHVIRNLQQDLEDVIAIQVAHSLVPVGGQFYPTATPERSPTSASIVTAIAITDGGGSRRVAVSLVLEGDTLAEVNRHRAYLLGRHTLPLTTGSLRRVVDARAAADCVVFLSVDRSPPPYGCGPGCAIPATLWCCIILVIVGILYVAFGGPALDDEGGL
jgi:hypothetical protein